jgi:thiopeptide-type bacteriocin biosynthesis protein
MKRNYCIGSEWLYYKIYSGPKTADFLLLEKLNPIVERLIAENIIDKWFFIRYKDPQEHIRIRFYSKSSKNLLVVISELFPVLNHLLEQDVIWKIQTETYQREIERYGENTIENSETLFWHDSELILKYLYIKSFFVKEETQLLFSFLSIDDFLNSFSLSNTEKLNLMDHLQLSFKKEFDADKVLKKEMDVNYRKLSQEINSFLTNSYQNEYPGIFKIINERQLKIKNVIPFIKSDLQISLSSFLTSHIHMMVNRQFTSSQRKYEAIIYDHLYRYYKTIKFQKGT